MYVRCCLLTFSILCTHTTAANPACGQLNKGIKWKHHEAYGWRLILGHTNIWISEDCRDFTHIMHIMHTYDSYKYNIGQTPKSDIPPNIAPKIVTPENFLQICGSSATLIGQLAIVTLFGAILGGIPLSGAYPFLFPPRKFQPRFL